MTKKTIENLKIKDYALGGLRNPCANCSHAINGNSSIIVLNDWVAVVIQYLAIGKATGITFANVSNRLITNIVSSTFVLLCQTVKTFRQLVGITVSLGIAVAKVLQSFNFKTIRGAL